MRLEFRNILIKVISFLVMGLMEWGGSKAQGPVYKLTVGQAIAAAMANNRGLKIAAIDERAASSRYEETATVYLPQASVAYSAMSTSNPLNAFGFRLQQKRIAASDFDPSRLNHPGGTPDFVAALDVHQPLVNMDRLYQRRAAKVETEIYRFRHMRAGEAVVFETRKAYMQLQLAYRVQAVMEDALATAKALYHYTADRAEQGMLSKADALNVQVQVKAMESRLAESRSGVFDASDYLGFMMGDTSGRVYRVDSAFSPAPAVGGDTVFREDRSDIAAFHWTVEASGLMVKSSKTAALPRLNAFGSYQLNDSRMFGFGAGGYLAGVTLSWDLFTGGSIRTRTATLQIERDKLGEQYVQLKERSVLELRAAFRKLGDAQYRIAQQEAAAAGAAESYRILVDRYGQGLSGSTDVLLAATQLSEQRLALAQAIFDRDVAGAYVEFLTTHSTSAK